MSGDHHGVRMDRSVFDTDWQGESVSEFEDSPCPLDASTARSPGLVSRMDEDAREAGRRSAGEVFVRHQRAGRIRSGCETAAARERFVCRSTHGKFAARRDEWLRRLSSIEYVIWPAMKGRVPADGEAQGLDRLEMHGASDEAFDNGYLSALESRTDIA